LMSFTRIGASLRSPWIGLSRSSAAPGSPSSQCITIGLARGVDLSAGLVLLVGVPFSPPTARTTKLLRRLGEIVGDEDKARLYGVILPGLWSALQAAGRAIRGPEDSADTDAGAGNSRDNSQDAF
jgi:hypothetical protein